MFSGTVAIAITENGRYVVARNDSHTVVVLNIADMTNFSILDESNRILSTPYSIAIKGEISFACHTLYSPDM